MEEHGGLFGQEVLLKQLDNAIRTQRVAHAYLICGEAGSGKQALARAFTKALFGQGEARQVGMEFDNSRLLAEGNHPDVMTVEPLGASIGIEQMRALQDKFALRSYAGRWKIGIITAAESMTAAAANSLLKLLEEPSGQAVLMLLTTNPSLLLPTIVSRCQMIRLRRISRKGIAAYLQAECGVTLEVATVIAGLSDGSLGRALEMLQGDYLVWRERVLSVVTAGQTQGLQALRLASTLDSDPGALEFALHVLATWFRDLTLVAKGYEKELVVHQDYLPELSARSDAYNVVAYQKAVVLIKEAWRAMGDNANRRLALDALFYQIAGLGSLAKVSEV